MKQKIKYTKDLARNLIKHPLFSGSAIMIVGSNFTNFLAYLYHLIIGRLLGPAAYGELASVITLLAMFSVTFTFLGMVIVKFVASGKKEDLNLIFSFFLRKSLLIGAIVFVILLALTGTMANFLHLSPKITVFVGPILFLSLLGFVTRSFLQGLLQFAKSVAVTNIELIIRFVVGLILILAGLSTFGAVFGILMGAMASFLLSIYFLRKFKIWKSTGKFEGSKEVLKYSLPVLLVSIATNLFFSSDVILVKHFFDAHQAGIYASLSTLGKIIFYGSAPVAAVMFPMVSNRYAKGENYMKIFNLSVILTIIITMGVLFVYLIIPAIAVNILFGSKFIEAGKNLFAYGLFMGIYGISSLYISFFLSIGKTKVVTFPIIFSLLQILGIILFHSSFVSVIRVSTISVSLLLVSLLLFSRYGQKSYQKTD